MSASGRLLPLARGSYRPEADIEQGKNGLYLKFFFGFRLISLFKGPQELLGHEIQITPRPGAGHVQLVAGLRVGLV